MLFEHQWGSGKVPHIVFNPEAPPRQLFPRRRPLGHGAEPARRPPGPAVTSGLCQPPVHAIAAHRIREVYEVENGRRSVGGSLNGFLKVIYPKLLRWHRYLLTNRDPEKSGLVTIFHPWESGTDNSPRWDAALERVAVGAVPGYMRRDLQHVGDPDERPTGLEYDRFIWLVELIRRARSQDAVTYKTHPFLVKDVLASAILVAANEALLEIARALRAPSGEQAEITAWISRGRRGLADSWDANLGLCLDRDLRANAPLRVRTVAGFAPLVAGGLSYERQLLETLCSGNFLAYPKLRWSLPPSTSPLEARFHPRSYWRGPVWPVIAWLLWWSLKRAGEEEHAEVLRRASLKALAEGGFAEYFEPFTGEPLRADDQSWTAAVALDWLADGA